MDAFVSALEVLHVVHVLVTYMYMYIFIYYLHISDTLHVV